MPNAKDLSLANLGLTWTLIGPPKSGKTYMALTAVDWVLRAGKQVRALLAPRAELVAYTGRDLEHEVLEDPTWDSAQRKFDTTISADFNRHIARWEAEWDGGKGGLLVIDTMNEGPSAGVQHQIIRDEGNDNFQQLSNRFQPYMTYLLRIKPLLTRLDLFRWRTNAHVLMLWHQEMKEYEPAGVSHVEQEKVSGQFKTFTHYKMALLPHMMGKQAQEIVLLYTDFAFYCQPVVNSNPYRCELKVLADGVRQAGARVPILGTLQKWPTVPNDFGKLMEVVRSVK